MAYFCIILILNPRGNSKNAGCIGLNACMAIFARSTAAFLQSYCYLHLSKKPQTFTSTPSDEGRFEKNLPYILPLESLHALGKGGSTLGERPFIPSKFPLSPWSASGAASRVDRPRRTQRNTALIPISNRGIS